MILISGCGPMSLADQEINELAMQPVINALELYKHDQGIYPAQLKDLVPDYLKSIPDLTTGDEPSYYILNNNYAIYFVVSDNQACGYDPRFQQWECGYGDG